jgi:hypothetical protein
MHSVVIHLRDTETIPDTRPVPYPEKEGSADFELALRAGGRKIELQQSLPTRTEKSHSRRISFGSLHQITLVKTID